MVSVKNLFTEDPSSNAVPISLSSSWTKNGFYNIYSVKNTSETKKRPGIGLFKIDAMLIYVALLYHNLCFYR